MNFTIQIELLVIRDAITENQIQLEFEKQIPSHVNTHHIPNAPVIIESHFPSKKLMRGYDIKGNKKIWKTQYLNTKLVKTITNHFKSDNHIFLIHWNSILNFFGKQTQKIP